MQYRTMAVRITDAIGYTENTGIAATVTFIAVLWISRIGVQPDRHPQRDVQGRERGAECAVPLPSERVW